MSANASGRVLTDRATQASPEAARASSPSGEYPSRMSRWAARVMARRSPNFVIGTADSPYIRRWWIIPRNRWFNVYLHEILRSDDDRALHDHPWWNCSILLDGRYIEHTIEAGGIERRIMREAGSIKPRLATAAHRLEILPGERAISLFVTGPRFRTWGFHCARTGWVRWQDFVAADNKGAIGRGCGERGE